MSAERTTWPERIVLGQQYGRLTILDRIPRAEAPTSHRWYLARCSCGSVLPVHGPRVFSGQTKSCGCLYRDIKTAERMAAEVRKAHSHALYVEARGRNEIELDLLRAAFARSSMSIRHVARVAGMDWTHVRRLVTETPVTSRKKGKVYGPYPYRTCTYETAVKLARAMDLDPFEVGI